MAASNGEDYILGYSQSEAERLDAQHVVCRRVNGDHAISPLLQTAVAAGEIRRVLDIGCGTGIWCYEAANELKASGVPTVTAVGLDIAQNDHWTKFASLDFKDLSSTIIFGLADLNDDTQMTAILERYGGTFDLVHAANLVSAVKKGKWQVHLERVFKLVRPGGYIQFAEFDTMDIYSNCIDPVGGEMLCIFHSAYNSLGLDVLCATEMAKRLANAGFSKISDNTLQIEPAWRDSKGVVQIDRVTVEWLVGMFRILRPLFLQVRQRSDYATLLETLPQWVHERTPDQKVEELLATEEQYDDAVKRAVKLATSSSEIHHVDPLLHVMVAQRPS